MTISTNELVRLVTTVTESISNNETTAGEALARLRNGLEDRFVFLTAQPLWHWTNCANDLLAEIIPEKAGVFVRPGDRTGPEDAKLFESKEASSIVIRAVMRGIKLFACSEPLKEGAAKLLEFCPNPVGQSSTPFVDSKFQWDHTHLEPSKAPFSDA
jgi:hypothetical protein